jgi:hypothetical protein
MWLAMIVRMIVFGVVAVTLLAQTRPSPDLDAVIRNLRSAIDKDDLTAAAELAAKLDDAVKQQFDAWLIRDASQRVDEVLTWLPEDTEALIVYEDPFVINASDSISDFDGQPGRRYTSDRLMALNGGKLYSSLAGVTVRLVAAGIKTIRDRSVGSDVTATPTPMQGAETAYFYFLAEPCDPSVLGAPDQTIGGHSAWLGTATVDAGAPIGTRERPTREDRTWLTFASPSLLVMSNSLEMVGLLLQRVTHGSQRQALPGNLAEWAEVDRGADFWGLRHYSDPGDHRDMSNPRSNLNPARQRDPLAIGVTVRLYAASRDLEIRYLSDAVQLPRFIDGPPTPQFKAKQVRTGLWDVTSNIHDRGDYPFHVAARLLGFGEYR